MIELDVLLAALAEHGLLLVQDPKLPSVATLVAGGPVRGAWWGHPDAHAIFERLGQLDDHPDALRTKLVSGKVTYLHRRLWPALLAVATARAPWQLAALDGPARALLARVDDVGAVEVSGPAVKTLERALLVRGGQVHTEAGSHVTALARWSDWPPAVTLTGQLTDAEGRAQLEATLGALNARFGARATLPWPREGGR